MIPVYKMIKLREPHCTECGEHLIGNNSMISPYRCSCGVWEYDMKNIDFKLKSKS